MQYLTVLIETNMCICNIYFLICYHRTIEHRLGISYYWARGQGGLIYNNYKSKNVLKNFIERNLTVR